MGVKTKERGERAAAKPSALLSARERLLAAADELFYSEGVHVVGADRIIERAGVSKATLDSTFGSKEELVRADLDMHFQTGSEASRAFSPHTTLQVIACSACSPRSRTRWQGRRFADAGSSWPALRPDPTMRVKSLPRSIAPGSNPSSLNLAGRSA